MHVVLLNSKYCTMYKVIRLEIGVEGPGLPDDYIELDVELSEQEYEHILSAYDRYFWDDDDLKDLFDDYLADFKKKFITLATPVAVGKWGECAKEENGARYYIFDPEEIEEAYCESDNYKNFIAAQDQMKANCRRQAKYEVHLLSELRQQGRWPNLKRTQHFDIFECWSFIGGMNCDYSFRAQCNGITVDYGKRYKLTGSRIEIQLSGLLSYRIELIDKHLSNCGREINVYNNGHYHVVHIPALEDETDIQILIPIFDQLESDISNSK